MRAGGLVLGGRIDRYVGSLFLASYATAFLLVVGLIVILQMASNLDWFEPWEGPEQAPPLLVVRYILLNIPFVFLEMAPFVTVVAGLFTVSKLLKHNEIVAALDAGVSAHRVVLAVFFGACAIAVGMLFLREGATATIGLRRDALLHMLEEQQSERMLENVWVRDAAGNRVHIDLFWPSRGDPPAVTIEGLEAFFKEDSVRYVVTAERAVWVRDPEAPGGANWALEGGEIKEIRSDGLLPREADMLYGLHFTPQDVLLADKARDRPMELSFSELIDVAQRRPGNVQLKTLLHYHMTFPLANVVLLLVAIPFMLSFKRGKGVEGLAAGCLLCVFYFAADFVSRSLGMEGTWSPVFSGWLPTLFFGSLGAVLFDAMRS